MDLKEIMAINLRRKRHDLEMTQEELAERAGLSARYVGAIERGDVSASVTVLGQIAEALENPEISQAGDRPQAQTCGVTLEQACTR